MPEPCIRYSVHDEIAVLCIENPPVNALSQGVRAGLLDALERAESDPHVRAVLICGAGRMFVAGADIKEFDQPPEAPFLPEVCARIEAMQVPVIAALHGVALGGGLEIALSSHYRICAAGTRLGLPEVTLGLIPGAGGTQRLPRLVGTQMAVDMIAGGRPIDADKALKIGLVDQVFEGAPLTAGLTFCGQRVAQHAPPRPTGGLPAPAPIDWEETTARVQKQARGQDAPVQAVRAIKAGLAQPFAEGLRIERDIFNTLRKSDQRKAMVHLFFAERATRNLPELAQARPRPIEYVAVVGGGTMGTGIACAALLAGLQVTVLEMSDDACAQASDRIAKIVNGAVERGKIDAVQARVILSEALTCTTSYDELATADLVIEAVVEDMATKKAVFRHIDQLCKPKAVLASNTSYLDIEEIAGSTTRADRVIGLHFFSPAHVMKLLEVVVPDAASPDAVATGFAFAKRLGKTAVRSGVCDGFIGNRILQRCRAVCDQMVLLGADPWQIDAALVAFGYPLGPYAVADLAGLDIGWANRKRLTALHGPDPDAARFPDMLCQAGHFGRKTGRGYYIYNDTGAAEPNPEVAEFIAQDRAARPHPQPQLDEAAIQRRFMAAMVNEAARIIDAGIAQRPSDVDVVLMAGYGFPRYRGGPLYWADAQGIAALRDEIRQFATQMPALGAPAPLLDRLAAEGLTFGALNDGACATPLSSEPPRGSL